MHSLLYSLNIELLSATVCQPLSRALRIQPRKFVPALMSHMLARDSRREHTQDVQRVMRNTSKVRGQWLVAQGRTLRTALELRPERRQGASHGKLGGKRSRQREEYL